MGKLPSGGANSRPTQKYRAADENASRPGTYGGKLSSCVATETGLQEPSSGRTSVPRALVSGLHLLRRLSCLASRFRYFPAARLLYPPSRRVSLRASVVLARHGHSLATVRRLGVVHTKHPALTMAARLNSAQREAVETLSGPLLVLAGAGTGKTRVVTYRIARLIQHGTQAHRILAVTFTNKAANEMQQRCAALIRRRRGAPRPEISTFHSLCVRILRRNAKQAGLPEQFPIYDRADQESLARAALREINVPGEMLRPSDLLALISHWKSAAVRPGEALRRAASDREHLAASAYRRYQKALEAAGAVDFDDLLLRTWDLFECASEVRRTEAARFDHVLIDEYQDTNQTQYLLVKALAEEHRNLCVVGDDDQSIYGWRGADVTHILRFERDWPGAKVVRLEKNYRSAAPILELANQLISYNRHRHPKQLRAARSGGVKPRIVAFPDEQIEAEEIVGEIRRAIWDGASPRDFAILFRTNQQPRPFENELRRQQVPYVLVGGMSFYDRREIRDMLAYLRAIATPTDDAAIDRILNTPPRGIGDTTRKRLLEAAVARGVPLWDVISKGPLPSDLANTAATAVSEFRKLIERLAARFDRSGIATSIRYMIDAIGYAAELDRLYSDPNERLSRWAAVEELVNAAAQYESRAKRPTLVGLLDEIALGGQDDSRDKESQLQQNAVALMTLHSAKGLEFPYVYLVGLEEGLLPHTRSIEIDGSAIDEERRLCYVGITRAQDRLTVSRAKTRRKWGKIRETLASRFLFEMLGMSDRAGDIARQARRRLDTSTGRPLPDKKADRSKPVKSKPSKSSPRHRASRRSR